MKIKKLPNVLALHLKRFKYQEESQRFIKLTYRVVFPLELRLFNTVDSSPDPDRLYSLWAIIVHIGVGPHAGHYVTIVRGTAGKWVVFDDENVSEIEESELSKYFGDTPGVGSGYVLFYQTVPQDDGPTAPLVHLAHKHRDLPSPPPAASPVPVPLATPMQGTFDIPPLSPVEPISPPGQPASGINRLFGSLSRRQANGLVGSQPSVPPVPPLPAFAPSPLSPRGALEVLADPERRSLDTSSLASEGDRMSNSSAAAPHSDSPPYARLGQDDSLPSIDNGSLHTSQPPSPVVAKESSRFGRFLRPKAKSSQSTANVPSISGPPSPTQLRHTPLSMDETVKRKSKR